MTPYDGNTANSNIGTTPQKSNNTSEFKMAFSRTSMSLLNNNETHNGGLMLYGRKCDWNAEGHIIVARFVSYLVGTKILQNWDPGTD